MLTISSASSTLASTSSRVRSYLRNAQRHQDPRTSASADSLRAERCDIAVSIQRVPLYLSFTFRGQTPRRHELSA